MFLHKVQNLPRNIRKFILWSIIVILGLALLFWWFNNFQKNIAGFQGGQFIEGLNLPEIKMPQLPEISEEELNKLKEAIEENGQQNNQ